MKKLFVVQLLHAGSGCVELKQQDGQKPAFAYSSLERNQCISSGGTCRF